MLPIVAGTLVKPSTSPACTFVSVTAPLASVGLSTSLTVMAVLIAAAAPFSV